MEERRWGILPKAMEDFFMYFDKYPPLINRCRWNNTMLSLIEFIAIIIYNVIPSKTNQAGFIAAMVFQALLMQMGSMIIHHAPMRTNYFNTSILVNMATQFILIMVSLDVYNLFLAMEQACNLVWDYYELKGSKPTFVKYRGNDFVRYPATGDDNTSAKAHDICVNNFFYYYTWFFTNCIVTALRTYSLFFMLRAQRFLTRRDDEKLKKKQRKRAKLAKLRRNRKRELGKRL